MREELASNSGRGLIETISSIVAILVICGMFAVAWLGHLKEAREVTSENQLTNLKYSLELYMILEGCYPEDLSELNKRCKLWAEDSLYSRRYLELQGLDMQGYPVDPYGRRFIYDNKTGRIKKGADK